MASQNACLRGCLKKNRIPRISSSFRLVFKGVRAEFTRSFYIYKVLLIKKKVTWWKREINTSMKIVKAIPLEKIIQFSSIGRELHTWKYYGFLEELRMLPSNIDVRNRHGKMCGFFFGGGDESFTSWHSISTACKLEGETLSILIPPCIYSFMVCPIACEKLTNRNLVMQLLLPPSTHATQKQSSSLEDRD